MAAAGRLAMTGELWRALWVSNEALVLGYLPAVLMGVPLGLFLGRFPAVGRFAGVYLDVLLLTPMPLLIPVLVVATGLGLATRLLVVFLFAVGVVVVTAEAGVRGVDPALLEMGRTFGAREGQLWRRILLPGTLPAIFGGLQLALGRAISGMVAVELLLIAAGLGRLMLRFQGDFDAPELYAVILVVVGEAVLLTALIGGGQRRLGSWQADVGPE
jgi:NitT/TauT family transport system permease protein